MTPPHFDKPILFVDVDGVVSLFGFPTDTPDLPGPFHWIDGVAHCIPLAGGQRLASLEGSFDLVWATGWEDKANEYLPAILQLPFGDLPTLTFDGRAKFGSSHWKLDPIAKYAGERPCAWIDDNLDEACRKWAKEREKLGSPTLLVETKPQLGITAEHVLELENWARKLRTRAVDAA